MQTWHRDLHVGLENARLRPLRVILQAFKVGRTWFWWCPRATKNQADPVQNQKVQSGAENHHSHYNCSFEATWRSMTIILTVLKSSSPPLAKYHLTRNQKPDFHLVSGLDQEWPWFGRDRVRISLWILDRPTKTVTFFFNFYFRALKVPEMDSTRPLDIPRYQNFCHTPSGCNFISIQSIEKLQKS